MEQIQLANKKLKTAHEAINAEYENYINRLNEEEKIAEKRFTLLEEKKKDITTINGNPTASDNDLIEINAGGKIIAAKRSTLTQFKGTRLEALFSGRWDKKLQRDSDGRIFLDVNSHAFQKIVDFLHEWAISPSDNPPDLPTIDGENQFILDHLLKLFTLKDKSNHLDSVIIKNDRFADIEQLHKWLVENDSDGEFRLLYRSSRDGFSAKAFHSACDNKGRTVTIIDTTYGVVFGGYTDMPWTSKRGNYYAKSFLFDLPGIDYPHGLPRKFKLRASNDCYAVVHDCRYGPVFGRGHDILTRIDESGLSILPESYDMGQMGTIWGDYTITDMEVFQIVNANEDQDTKANQIKETKSFSQSINAALNTKLHTIEEAKKLVTTLEKDLDDEISFVELFSSGDTKDVVKLNVSGTVMTTKRSTLLVFEESVLAQQFDDSRWTVQQASNVKQWTPDGVSYWAQSVTDISDEVANIFMENKITGNELLALEKDGLQMIGIKRPGTLCLLLKEIQKLEKASRDTATLIEHSPYCFGKILEYLRMKRLQSQQLLERKPRLPIVCESERCRFEKVAKYFFPGQSSELILGMGMPITIKMAREAIVDPNSSSCDTGDFLKDGRPLHTVNLVAAVRAYEELLTVLIDIEDGTGSIQVEMRRDSTMNSQKLQQICKLQTYVRVIGQVEDFGGERHFLATDVRPLSSGDDVTNHFLEVAKSYDIYSLPRKAVLRCVREVGAQNENGVHIDTILLATEGFSASTIRNAVNELAKEGLILSTIDEKHYDLPKKEPTETVDEGYLPSAYS